MIINTGARTDTVQYYSEWLLKRFKEGFVYARNPLFQNKVIRYELNPELVDCVEFCSKNYAPILLRLYEITSKFNTHFHYTITAYGKDVEPGVPSIEESVATLIELSKLVGRERVVWRYDPILLTEKYTIDLHFETFRKLAEQLAPYIERCVFSFVEMHRKVRLNMPEIIPMTEENKQKIAEGIGKIAANYGIFIQTCGTNGDFSKYEIHSSGCMTLEMLGKANNIEFRKLKHRGTREGCHCIESRDIGCYDSCLNGCKYCYANINPRKAIENYKLHNPDSPILLGEIKDTDTIQQAVQKSFLK